MSSVQSSYTKDFFLWLIEQISFREVVAAYFPSRAELQRTLFFNNFSQSALGFTRKVIGRFEHRIWSDRLTYFMDDILISSAILKPFWVLNDASQEAVVYISQILFPLMWLF